MGTPIDTDDRIRTILEYLVDVVNLDEKCIRSIKSAINSIHEICPVEITEIFRRMDNLIACSEDLGWTISVLENKKNSLTTEYKNIRDPKFTSLTRKGRPSTVAIECEIRYMDSNVLMLEDRIGKLSGIIDYLNHLELCIDRMLWAIKYRISIGKM